MEKDTAFDAKHSEDEKIVSASTNPQPQGVDQSRTMKRENDSMDDFEHLEHEGSPLDETARTNVLDATSVQLIDVPRAVPGSRVSELMDVASKLERNILDTSIPADERILQPVPATPPPSADFEKFERQLDDATSAQTLHQFDAQDRKHQQRQVNEISQVDPKAATMAFMDTERVTGDYHNLEKQRADKGIEEEEEKDDTQQYQHRQPNPDNRGADFAEHVADDYAEREHRDAPQDFSEENNGAASGLAARLAPDKSPIDDNFAREDRDSSNKAIDEISSSTHVKKVEPTSDEHSNEGYASNIVSSVIPGPQKSPEFDFLADDPPAEVKKMPSEKARNLMDDDTWNVVEKPDQRASSASFVDKEAESAVKTASKAEREYFEAPTKPLPPLPKSEIDEEDEDRHFSSRTDYERERASDEKFEMSNDFMGSGGNQVSAQRASKNRGQQQQSGAETGDSEFESAPEQSPAKSSVRSGAGVAAQHGRKVNADDIAPKEIFTDMGLDAWFNPERLNPKVAALIYWRQPEKTGIVFGAILGVLLSLAYFSLISVFAYLSLLTLTGTVGFRVYKTFMQAVQKTSDGHPFKDILEVDLTLPSEKVHEVADVAVAHANAAFAELRRLFLVEDFIDSLKFGVVLWCFTYLGSWFNGMTLIIIGVVALFTLPKVYETNKSQIDQNVALVHGKINELTAKVKAAIPLGKKAEPTKEE